MDAYAKIINELSGKGPNYIRAFITNAERVKPNDVLFMRVLNYVSIILFEDAKYFELTNSHFLEPKYIYINKAKTKSSLFYIFISIIAIGFSSYFLYINNVTLPKKINKTEESPKIIENPIDKTPDSIKKKQKKNKKKIIKKVIAEKPNNSSNNNGDVKENIVLLNIFISH